MTKVLNFAQTMVGYAMLLLVFTKMFSLGTYSESSMNVNDPSIWKSIALKLDTTPEDVDTYTEWFVPIVGMVVVGHCALMAAAECCYALCELVVAQRTKAGAAIRSVALIAASGTATAAALCLISVPLFIATPSLRADYLNPSNAITLRNAVPRYGLDAYNAGFGKFSSSYGLFRQMTGVGDGAGHNLRDFGWAGLPPSVVARPEIVFEGLFSVDDEGTQEWRELNFHYKPTDVKQAPKWVAPYQPRFDWQLWFAALGTYNNNPWLISFVDKLMEGVDDVKTLVDGDVNGILAVKATLWDYDFTRSSSEWNDRIPGVTIVGGNSDVWWSRKNPREYLPVLEKGNNSVKEFLKQYSIDFACSNGGIDRDDRHGLSGWLSDFRENNGIWSPVIAIFFAAALMRLKERGWLPDWLGKRRGARAAAAAINKKND
jgi:hypothetical protein